MTGSRVRPSGPGHSPVSALENPQAQCSEDCQAPPTHLALPALGTVTLLFSWTPDQPASRLSPALLQACVAPPCSGTLGVMGWARGKGGRTFPPPLHLRTWRSGLGHLVEGGGQAEEGPCGACRVVTQVSRANHPTRATWHLSFQPLSQPALPVSSLEPLAALPSSQPSCRSPGAGCWPTSVTVYLNSLQPGQEMLLLYSKHTLKAKIKIQSNTQQQDSRC